MHDERSRSLRLLKSAVCASGFKKLVCFGDDYWFTGCEVLWDSLPLFYLTDELNQTCTGCLVFASNLLYRLTVQSFLAFFYAKNSGWGKNKTVTVSLRTVAVECLLSKSDFNPI